MPRLAGGPIFPRFFYYVELSKDLYKSWPTVLGHPPGPVIALHTFLTAAAQVPYHGTWRKSPGLPALPVLPVDRRPTTRSCTMLEPPVSSAAAQTSPDSILPR